MGRGVAWGKLTDENGQGLVELMVGDRASGTFLCTLAIHLEVPPAPCE